VNDELERMWNEMAMVYFKYLQGGNEENHKTLFKIVGLWADI
jgi:hypothetical protein